MSTNSTDTAMNRDRLEELLVDHALIGLTDAEALELDELEGHNHDESYEFAAASLSLSLDAHEEMMPSDALARVRAGVMAQISAQAPAAVRADAQPVALPAAGARRADEGGPYRLNIFPWFVAAAAVGLAVVAWWPGASGPSPAPGVPTVAEQRSALLSDGQVTQASWQVLEDPSASEFVEGDVVWSDAKQKGYMRFVGLKPNDPSEAQYQLWIFDESRSADHPVDGGVFDVTESGEVIVPIDAKIRIDKATMFAITVERPGGVVVSDRSRLPLLAQPAAG